MHDLPGFLQGVPIIPQAMLQYAYRFLVAFLGVGVCFVYAKRLMNVPCRMNNFFAWLGRISLGIYTVHMFLLGRAMGLWRVIVEDESSVLFVIPLFLILTSVSMAVIWMFGKIPVISLLFFGKSTKW